MTKLKNTKKGMAKKALSISLVAAMLATSNVPVWAAEDLFSDGSTTVEVPQTFTDEVAAPVEEVTPDTPDLAAVEGQNANISITGVDEGTIDINEKTSVTATSKNIYIGAGETINVNWYISENKNQVYYDKGTSYSGTDASNSAAGFVYGGSATTSTNKYIASTYNNIEKENLGKYLTAVVWQKDASGDTWTVVAKSASALIVSSNADDYVPGFSSMSLNQSGSIKADTEIGIRNVPKGVTIQWYRDGAVIAGETGNSYKTTAEDVGRTISAKAFYKVEGYRTFEGTVGSVEVWGVGFTWDFNGTVIENGGVAYDAGLLSLKTSLPTSFAAQSATLKLEGQSGTASIGSLTNGIINASYKLSKEDIGREIKATVTIRTTSGKTLTFTDKINITDSYIVLEGKPAIKVTEGGADIRPGVTLQADTTNVSAPSDPNFTEYHYQWQRYNPDTKKWENVENPKTDDKGNKYENTYVVTEADYGKKLRVAVFGGEFYLEDKSVFSDEVNVEAADVEGKATVVWMGAMPEWEKEFNPLDAEANKLVDENGNSLIAVYYEGRSLTSGKDYTLKYEGIDQIGKVTVTVYFLPTDNTNYSSGQAGSFTYTLSAPDENDNFVITSSTSNSEYNGKVATPSVKIKNIATNQFIDESEYKVYTVGPDAGIYDVKAYVNGQGMATSINPIDKKQYKYTINPKNIANHTSDFNLVIPDAVWDASEEAVKNNAVKNAKIQLFDNAIDSTEDLLEVYGNNVVTIQPINWGEGGVKKSIKITFKSVNYNSNYTGSITVEGTVNSRSISQFQAQFTEQIRSEAVSRVYNGKLQDVLGEILDGNNGCIKLQNNAGESVRLYEGRDFEYKIIKGGTDVGDVSIYVEGKGNYDGNMTLSNVYSITKANFRNDVKGSEDFSVTYDPSLGDAGASISAYTDLAKSKYTASMIKSGYKLTLNKDFWLDEFSIANDWKEIWFTPTVAENKVEGHGENTNFVTTDWTASKDPVWVYLVDKNLNDSDIQVTVESAEYNGGKLVTPKVKVAYVKDGKEYVISSDYYDVQIIQSAYDQGETGKVNIIAKQDLTNSWEWDSQKYPQLYTGNKMVDYTVGKTNLALGKIVATNGLSTLPSVAYDAAQAATEAGITLDASKYVVKDASGNIVDPKYYTVSYTDNKTVGTATITVTGKAQYEGSVSATFTITKNNLPSGTVTLMSDKLSKVYTGEDIELVKGTDYNITGELAGLKEGTDYMIVYENNVNVTDDKEKAEFKVVGINNYAGEVVKYFDITPATITSSNITLGDAVYQGGVAVRPAVTITVPGGNATLTEGTDYTVSYLKAATNAGDEGLVQITYADNKNINTKDSAKEATYKVTAKDLKDVTILEIADQEATGEQLTPEVTVMNGTVKLVKGKDYKVTYGDNKEIGLGTVTIQPADGNKNYTGSQEAVFKIIKATPEVGQPTISEIKVSGNTVTPVLSEEVDGAVGYDFVISTVEDTTNGRVDVSKNVLKTNTNFYYVEAGTYYVYCHAYKRGEDGTKQFGEWSNIMKVVVTATTPETPKITKLQKSSNGKHLKITWTKSADATGYDIVMGTAARKVNGELRPVDYGKAVKKVTNGNTVSVIFYNVPKGTYYVGLHAYNRTSESGVKVFSKWSGAQKVTFK